MIYEIVNPSDPYTIEADDLEIAFAACIILGRGQYGLDALQPGGKIVPLMIFGGTEQAETYCQEEFGKTLEEVIDSALDQRKLELANCLDSVLIGRGLESRQRYQEALTEYAIIDEPAYRMKRHDEMRSSMNDIGGRAYRIAARLRKGEDKPIEPAPQQVFPLPNQGD